MNLSRREVMLGSMLLGASGAAYALTPRRKYSLLGDADLDKMIPHSFGGWRAVPTDALVVPKTEDSLVSRLYSQSVGRVYENDDNEIVMMLVAYGSSQSDQLQLHRPEICYPAFGFQVRETRPISIPLAGNLAIPARRMVASSDLRREQIAYWTRVGEYLPTSGSDQRLSVLRTQLSGLVADGVLVRLSNLRHDSESGFQLNRRFAADFLKEVSKPARRVLLGTALADRLSTWA